MNPSLTLSEIIELWCTSIFANTNSYFGAGNWAVDSDEKPRQASRMRHTARAPVSGLLFSLTLLPCSGGCWETESLCGNTADLWKCSRPRSAGIFLPERYYLPLEKKDASKTMIQEPISLASSTIHAVASICVSNKSFPTLHCMWLLHASKAEKKKSCLSGCIDEEVQHVFTGSCISCVADCPRFRKRSSILPLTVHSLSEEKKPHYTWSER